MKNPFTSRRDAQITDLQRQLADAEARYSEAEGKRRTLARWLAEADATNKRLNGRNRELSKRLDDAHDNQLTDTVDVLRAEARIRRLLKVAERLADAVRTSERRAELLQQRYDDAVGIPRDGWIKDSGPWQPGYEEAGAS